MEKLIIYQKSLQLVLDIYKLTRNNLLLAKDYSLVDQIKRASTSIATNIAEGYCRSNKQFRNYLQISSGSSNEVIALLQIISMVYKINTMDLQNKFKFLGRQINAFSKNLKTNN